MNPNIIFQVIPSKEKEFSWTVQVRDISDKTKDSVIIAVYEFTRKNGAYGQQFISGHNHTEINEKLWTYMRIYTAGAMGIDYFVPYEMECITEFFPSAQIHWTN